MTRTEFGRVVRDSWLVLGIALIILGAIEIGFSIAFRVRDSARGAGNAVDYRIYADAYFDSTWVKQYYEEFRRSLDLRWEPYVYWRHKRFVGRYINIDSNGIRRSWTPPSASEPSRSKKMVFMFGGSTVWGTGVRDEFTVPSLLGRELWSIESPVEVVNFGEVGFVSTQEVVALLLELRRGNIPEVVVFYDGLNDTYSAFQQHVAGLPQNEFNRVREFNLSQPARAGERRRKAVQQLVAELSATRFLAGLLRAVGARAHPFVKPPLSDSQETDLARQVVARYSSNIQLVRSLSRDYGFAPLFYWQPTIFDKPQLSEFEKARRIEMAYVETFFQRVGSLIRESDLAAREGDFRDLSLAFAAVPEPMFVDFGHLADAGNHKIAQLMAQDVRKLLRASTPSLAKRGR